MKKILANIDLKEKQDLWEAEKVVAVEQKETEKFKTERAQAEFEKLKYLMDHPRLANNTTFNLSSDDLLKLMATNYK